MPHPPLRMCGNVISRLDQQTLLNSDNTDTIMPVSVLPVLFVAYEMMSISLPVLPPPYPSNPLSSEAV